LAGLESDKCLAVAVILRWRADPARLDKCLEPGNGLRGRARRLDQETLVVIDVEAGVQSGVELLAVVAEDLVGDAVPAKRGMPGLT
jgi:hypothetical protein